jgi:hypothetical protein
MIYDILQPEQSRIIIRHKTMNVFVFLRESGTVSSFQTDMLNGGCPTIYAYAIVAIPHSGQASRSEARAGIQKFL